MVILRTRNKIIDFLMILAWASPFKCLISLQIMLPTVQIKNVKKRYRFDKHSKEQLDNLTCNINMITDE